MRIIITGGSGFIGRKLSAAWVADNHEVIILSRNPSARNLPAGVRAEKWDGRTADGWGKWADGAGAIVNLAGESISGGKTIPSAWSDEQKAGIAQSRLNAGKAVVEAVDAASVKPGVVFQISGIDYYGFGDQVVTEESPPGTHFLAQVVRDYWEAGSAGVEALGVRRVVGRLAPVMDTEAGSGPLPSSLLQFKLFAGGRLGSGKQWLAWVHSEDAIRAIKFLTEHPTAAGPYNISAPGNITNKQFTDALAAVTGRPALIPVPEFALKTLLGETASLVLQGRPVGTQKLMDLGFEYRFPTIEAALRDLLGK
jgi:hypothetical protein